MANWSGKTIGPLLGYKIFLLTLKIFGITSAYFILRFVSYYYFCFAKGIRTHLVDFYKTALNISTKEALSLTKKNFYVFGQTLIDRAAFLLNKEDAYSYTFTNESVLLQMHQEGKGGILLSAHLGNWETAGNLLRQRVSSKINALMLDSEVEKVKKYLTSKTGGSQFNIIPIKNDLSHIISIKNALDNNEFIAIHADRCLPNSRNITVQFFGKPLRLPYGPFIIAERFKVPVSFVYAIKANSRHYHLSATIPLVGKQSAQIIAQAYAVELEKMVLKQPEQWFNFYNYFEQ